ncbi:MAG: hypothetical protein JNK85_03650 [Verrucomicrobiales bacterium]|nr:hypothetical protein [Verrucomicrobiales bacterium]
MHALRKSAALGGALLIGTGAALSAHAATVVRSDAGATPADILDTVNLFRADVSLGGGVNPGGGGPFENGRRQITWDGVPDVRSEPNFMPPDQFLNTARQGAFFDTPGSGFFTSADNANPTATAPLFNAINPAYAGQFQAFSAQRLFIAVDSIITDTFFFIPSDPTSKGVVNGFGAVFADVDLADETTIEYFDSTNQSLGIYDVPASSDGGLSFLGVTFGDGERVARVRITSGTAPLSALNVDGPGVDVVAMDDFIYGEPQPVPEASTWMGASALAGMAWLARRRRAAKA